MTDIDIDAIRQRANRYEQTAIGSGKTIQAIQLADADVPALLAKVDELTADIDDRDSEISTLKQDLDLQTKAAWANRSDSNHLTALVKVLTAERDDAREHLLHARPGVATLREREQNALAQLTQSRAQAATYANEIGNLTAENARLRQQRDGLIADLTDAGNEVDLLTAENTRLRSQLGDVASVQCWTNEDGKRFVFVTDLQAAIDALPKTAVAR